MRCSGRRGGAAGGRSARQGGELWCASITNPGTPYLPPQRARARHLQLPLRGQPLRAPACGGGVSRAPTRGQGLPPEPWQCASRRAPCFSLRHGHRRHQRRGESLQRGVEPSWRAALRQTRDVYSSGGFRHHAQAQRAPERPATHHSTAPCSCVCGGGMEMAARVASARRAGRVTRPRGVRWRVGRSEARAASGAAEANATVNIAASGVQRFRNARRCQSGRAPGQRQPRGGGPASVARRLPPGQNRSVLRPWPP